MKWYHSLKTHIAAALVLQLVLVILMAIFSMYELNLRKHDYAVLNLSGQLRVISQHLVSQSQNYKIAAPRDYESYNRDLKIYHKNIQKQLKNYAAIISDFQQRKLSVELTGQSEPIYCTWDERSVNQLNKTAEQWQVFIAGFKDAIGDNEQEPRLEYAANFIVDNGGVLIQSADRLAQEFQTMMETKLDNINRINVILIIVFIVINLGIIFVFYKKIFQPLDATRKIFKKVANGNLNCQVEISSKNEIGLLSQSFNVLTQRLYSLLRLTERIHQAESLDESLKIFHKEFKCFFPINLVCMIRKSPNAYQFTLERIYSDVACDLHENDKFALDDPILHQALTRHHPLTINQLQNKNNSELSGVLLSNEFVSVLSLPMESMNDDDIILVIAAQKKDAYLAEHIDLLENLTTQLSHSLYKTIGMEGLVISTIDGLAKLAESRDPETGDHLIRMSLYSAIIAEELSKKTEYKDIINAAYVRDILRFSPMHDIGKVGIEDRILLKPGKLTAEERAEMEQHPVIGAKVLKRCEQQMNEIGRSIFKMGIEITESHHEKYDGSGYPKKLKADEIPLSARIVAAADVFDALTSKRPYKDAWPVEKAMKVMKEDAGKHFDPQVITALENAMPKVMDVYNEHKHI